MYSYIGRTELAELVQANRVGFIISNIKTSDIDEYINSLMGVLRSHDIDNNMFVQPKIRRLSKNRQEQSKRFMLMLVVRKDIKIDKKLYKKLEHTINNIVKCETLQEHWYRLVRCNNVSNI